jgi:hypothetical protein
VGLHFESRKQNEVNARRMSAIHEAQEVIRLKCKTLRHGEFVSAGEEPRFGDLKDRLDGDGIWHIEGFVRFDVIDREGRMTTRMDYKVNLKWSNGGWEVVSVSLD